MRRKLANQHRLEASALRISSALQRYNSGKDYRSPVPVRRIRMSSTIIMPSAALPRCPRLRAIFANIIMYRVLARSSASSTLRSSLASFSSSRPSRMQRIPSYPLAKPAQRARLWVQA